MSADSYNFPEKWSDFLEKEAKAQGITDDEILHSFKEDYPQGYFILFEQEKHTRPLTEEEFERYSQLWLGYKTGYIRRGMIGL